VVVDFSMAGTTMKLAPAAHPRPKPTKNDDILFSKYHILLVHQLILAIRSSWGQNLSKNPAVGATSYNS
jgi:hypothetical protein